MTQHVLNWSSKLLYLEGDLGEKCWRVEDKGRRPVGIVRRSATRRTGGGPTFPSQCDAGNQATRAFENLGTFKRIRRNYIQSV